MSIYNLGRVLPIFKGEYNPTETYENLDVVLYNGSSYVAIDTTTNNPPTDENYWVIVAMAGTLSPEQIEYVEQQVIEYVQGQGYVIDENYTHTDNNFTNAEKAKLDNIDMSTKQDTLVSGTNIKTINNESILGSGNITIQGGSGGTSDYTDLTNKPSINGVELSGNKTNSQLGIPTKTSDITNDSGFLTSESEPAFNSSVAKDITSTDISNWNNKLEPSSGANKIYGTSNAGEQITLNYASSASAATIPFRGTGGVLSVGTPTGATHATTKQYVDNNLATKQDTLVSGTNIKTINNESLLGNGNITIQGGSTPETINVSDTTYTIASLEGNKIYNFSNALTSLTITAFGNTDVETVLNFEAGNSFSFTAPLTAKYIIEEPTFNTGNTYLMSIQHNTIVVGEVV